MDSDDTSKLRADGGPDGRGHAVGSKGTRFSANDGRPRGGRPKGRRDNRTIVQSIHDLPVLITRSDGRKEKISTFEAILLAMRQKAIAGDLRAAEFIMKHFERYLPTPIEMERTSELLADDELILGFARSRGLVDGKGDGV